MSVLFMIACLVLLPTVTNVQSLLTEIGSNVNAPHINDKNKNTQYYGKLKKVDHLAMVNKMPIASLMQIHARIKLLSLIIAMYLFQAFLLR